MSIKHFFYSILIMGFSLSIPLCAQTKVITQYYPAYDSVGMAIPIEYRYEVLTQDTTIKHGAYIHFSKEGDTLQQYVYDNNRQQGIQKDYYSDGQLKAQVEYDKGIRKGQANFYEYNGRLLFSEQYQYLQPDLVSFNRYNAHATLIATGFLLHNKLDSIYLEYYEQKQIKTKAQYKNGELNGTVLTYYPNGKLLQEAHFIHHQLHGKVKLYNEV